MNKKLVFLPVLFAIPVLVGCGSSPQPQPEPTKVDYLDVTMDSSHGYDIYQMPEGRTGYRYGPSIMVEENESGNQYHAWFATSGFDTQCWDVFSYKSSTDGKNWSEEKVVTYPMPRALDTYSVCDPSVIKIGEYYYMGYTSTYNSNQRDNNAYVARSKSPEGPWDRWNGTDWGGRDIAPIYYWDEYGYGSDSSYWGSGEPSFVVLDNTIYAYITYEGCEGRTTKVLVGDATSPNWPGTLVDKGICLGAGSNDSLDVAYVDEYKRFIAVATDNRFTADSFLAFYQSFDGLTFTLADVCKKDVCWCCHNSGISKNQLGHITSTMSPFVGYAYQSGPESGNWGVWNTRFQNITIGVHDNLDVSELDGDNYHKTCDRDTRDPSSLPWSGIIAWYPNSQSCEYATATYNSTIELKLYVYNSFRSSYVELTAADALADIHYSFWDQDLVQPIDASKTIQIKNKAGSSRIGITWRGLQTETVIRIAAPGSSDTKVVGVEPMCNHETARTYKLDLSNRDAVQPKIKVNYESGIWEELAGSGVGYSGYDNSIISIVTTSGVVKPKKVGETNLTMTYSGYSTTVKIIVTDQGMNTIDFTNARTAPMNKFLVHSSSKDMTKNVNNDISLNLQRGYLRATAKGDDPYMIMDNSLKNIDASKITKMKITYRVESTSDAAEIPSAIYFATLINNWEASKRVDYNLVNDGEWHTDTVTLAGAEGYTTSMNYMRFDIFEGNFSTNDTLEIKTLEFVE